MQMSARLKCLRRIEPRTGILKLFSTRSVPDITEVKLREGLKRMLSKGEPGPDDIFTPLLHLVLYNLILFFIFYLSHQILFSA